MSPALSCADLEPLIYEMALGLLDGQTRSDAIEHVSSCAACRRLLEELGTVLDELITAVPEAEPPPGFEGRVVGAVARAAGTPAATMRPEGSPPDEPRPTRARARLRPALAVAALALIALVTGVLVSARSRPEEVRTATMVSTGGPVGEVEVGDVAGNPAGGNAGADTVRVSLPAWATDPAGSPPYLLRVELADGTTRDLGWFRLTPQRSDWSAPLGGYAEDVRRVLVLNEAGNAVCHGDLA